MNALELKVPPPLVAIAVGAIMWGVALPGVGDLPRGLALTVAAMVFASAGAVVVVAAMTAFRRAKTTVNPFKPESASSLVTGGIYRITRNPMYLSLLLVLAGWAFFLANWLSALAIVLFPAYITRFQIQPEERTLRRLFGEQYASYSSRVRRWL